MFRNSVCLVIKQIGIGTLSQNEYLNRETGQFFEGQGHYDSQMKHFCQYYSSESLQCLSFVLHIQTINGKKKPHHDFWVKRSKVNLPATFWLPLISNWISLQLLITDTSDFVKIWGMMIGIHSEHQMIKRLLVKVSNTCFLIVLGVYMQFWWIVQALVFRICGLLLKRGELSMFWIFSFHHIDYFTHTSPERRDIVQVM